MGDRISKILAVLLLATVFVFACIYNFAFAVGDGKLLKRSSEETCHACHKTNKNTPATSSEYKKAIKGHNSALMTSGKWSGNWGVAGGKYGEIICTTCHTAHDTFNIYLIKETVTSPNSPADAFPGGAVDFRVTSGAAGTTGTLGDDSDLGRVSATKKICEVCHKQNKYHNYDRANNTGGNNHYNANDCTTCHSHKNAFQPTCIGCHSIAQGTRAVITSQFSANSHHIQGATLTDALCYTCHWEANDDGSLNPNYHGGSKSSGAPVRLVVYSAGGVRPTTYTLGVTAVEYTANGSRTEIAKINTHCLGCHSDQNDTATPFGDSKTPKQYAWDSKSIASRYSQTGTTAWGKYSGANVTPKNSQTKALSAHGNASANQRGWDTSETWSNTSGTTNVACYDCHNSHGSTVSGTTTSYTSATTSGGILKDTVSGKGGYSVTYKPQSGGSSGNKNVYNAGAGLCFDCHMNAAATTTPWGYTGTFGASQVVMGYWDTQYFGAGTFGSTSRFAYKTSGNQGGHFGVSSSLLSAASGTIGGLCTPCHDPHGVTDNPAKIATANKQYAVPLLKGTWMTSPYKEDAAPSVNSTGFEMTYRIDQNTFGADISNAVPNNIMQTDTQFAGLCLSCHSKSNLTNGTTHTWKSKDRVHESVKGWKTANGTIQHTYTCSKCHVPHNSRLPRLMATNCLDSAHKGRVAFTSTPVVQGSGSSCSAYEYSGGPGCGSGSGRIPGSYSGTNPGNHLVTCHENNTGSGTDQKWNTKTPWSTPTELPALASPTAASIGTTTATLGANVTSNGGGISARGTVWGTALNPTGNAVAEGGTATGVFTHARSSLTAGTKIYYRGYATNGIGTAYSPNGSFYTEPSSQASGVNFTSISANNMTVNWTRGNGDGVIVLMKQGSAVNSDPADGTYTTYTANAAFQSGTQIGSGNYVIYKGTGTSVAVSGLLLNTTYYVAVYEYKGTVDTSGVDQGTNYKPSPATGSQITSPGPPILTSPTAASIGSATATLGANVTNDGGSSITARGTVWGTALNPTGNAVAEGGTATGVFTHARSSITAGTKIYYRGYATNSAGTAYSPDGSFYTEPSSQASLGSFTPVGDNNMTVNWTRGSGDGVIVLMKQGSAVNSEPGDGTYTTYTANAAFLSGTQIGSGNYVIYKGTGASVAVTNLLSGTAYYVAVYEYKGTVDTSGVDQGTNYISPATGSQTTTGAPAPNAPALTVNSGCGSGVCSTTCSVTLQWTSGGGGDADPQQYYVEIDTVSAFNSPNLQNSGWVSGTSWATPQLGAATWYWRVKARDSVHTTAESYWSSTSSFPVTNEYDECSCYGCSSCPFVFVWDGREYKYVTDVAGTVIGLPKNAPVSKAVKLFEPSYITLGSLKPDNNGQYKIKLRETLQELDYVDEMKLLVIDYPKGRQIVSSSAESTYGWGYKNPFKIYTIKDPVPPISAVDKHGKDILDSVLRVDNNTATVAQDSPDNFYTFDFGKIKNPSRAKLVIDGWTLYKEPNILKEHKGDIQPFIEVVDRNGKWVKAKSFGATAGDLKTTVIDIAGVFLSDDHRIRLHTGIRDFKWVNRWIIDRIMLDDSEPVEVKIVNEVEASSAELRFAGRAPSLRTTTTRRISSEDGKLPVDRAALSYGKFTKYGEVKELLSKRDDKFVIMRHGDEIELMFPAVDGSPAKGMERGFMLKADLYYKSFENSRDVEPLPFHAMTSYPPSGAESYPRDKEHLDYIAKYNTREYTPDMAEVPAVCTEEKTTENRVEIKPAAALTGGKVGEVFVALEKAAEAGQQKAKSEKQEAEISLMDKMINYVRSLWTAIIDILKLLMSFFGK